MSDTFGIRHKEIKSVNLVKSAFHLTTVTESIIQNIIQDLKNSIAKDIQTRFQKSWDTVQIVNKKGMQ